MGLRRIARECALQMLYQFDVGKHSSDEIRRTFWLMNDQPAKVQEFAGALFQGSIDRIEELDGLIQKLAAKNK